MFTYTRAMLTSRHSWRTFAFVHVVELVGLAWFLVFFYTGTFIFSLLRWP